MDFSGIGGERIRSGTPAASSFSSSRKKSRIALGCGSSRRRSRTKVALAWIDLASFGDYDGQRKDGHGHKLHGGGVCDIPLFSVSTGKRCRSICLEPGVPYTIGRSPHLSHFVFNDSRVSKQHCQILFDASFRKLYLLDGVFSFSDTSTNCIVDEFRNRLLQLNGQGHKEMNVLFSTCTYSLRSSTNGVFVNGVRVGDGVVVELSAGDEVMFVCTNANGICGSCIRIGFIIQRIVFQEELVMEGGYDGFSVERSWLLKPLSNSKGKKRVFAVSAEDSESLTAECDDIVGRTTSLLAHCRGILRNDDPISYIRGCPLLDGMGVCSRKRKREHPRLKARDDLGLPLSHELPVKHNLLVAGQQMLLCDGQSKGSLGTTVVPSGTNLIPRKGVVPGRLTNGNLCQQTCDDAPENYEFIFSSLSPKGGNNLGKSELQGKHNLAVSTQQMLVCDGQRNESLGTTVVPSGSKLNPQDELVPERVANNSLCQQTFDDVPESSEFIFPSLSPKDGSSLPTPDFFKQESAPEKFIPPPGKGFYLNRLKIMQNSTFDQQKVVSLPELIFPVDSISRIFIATFTSNISWFLSYCNIPHHLPVTIACHSAERCWSASPDKRYSEPLADFPNLVLVFPPFPEAIAFGKDRKRQGVACHHPKLLVVQRENNIRVIVTSANLVEKQWNNVTNTIWWQDFPRRSSPDYLSLFSQIHDGDFKDGRTSDFAAQLAGFMASLLADVPNQGHWIDEVTKYDFSRSEGYLVASVPGVHSHRAPSVNEDISFLPCRSRSSNMKFLGSVEASVVGLSHLFRTAADSNGTELKRLAAFLGKACENAYGASEVILKRTKSVPADANAMCILVPNPQDASGLDCVQLGFLPRNIAKWVSPLWDAGFFSFIGYICPKEALAAALEGSGVKVQLILRVAQGPNFLNISEMIKSQYATALCSLVASLKRCTGLWRLEEVLNQYKWPEPLESDFVYGASSIGGSVSPPFLAAFSSAVGKKSVEAFDSEESDPEWGCWNASHERKQPSVRIVFPTIDRVENAQGGVCTSKYMLCFTEKTWQKLKHMDILHDAVPHPSCRVGHPSHAKVARRRFQSKVDASPFGWVYCGSHNLSAAAWGRPISCSSGREDRSRSRAPFDSRLHVCNYELGILFVYPPPGSKGGSKTDSGNIDDIALPFIVPPPKYGQRDRPATQRAMKEASTRLAEQADIAAEAEFAEDIMEEMIEEDEEATEVAIDNVAEEKEDEKAYAEMLWSQFDSV